MNLKAFTLVCVRGSQERGVGGGIRRGTGQHSFERQVKKIPGILYLMLSFVFFRGFQKQKKHFYKF